MKSGVILLLLPHSTGMDCSSQTGTGLVRLVAEQQPQSGHHGVQPDREQPGKQPVRPVGNLNRLRAYRCRVGVSGRQIAAQFSADTSNPGLVTTKGNQTGIA